MLYTFLKTLFKSALHVFFKEFKVINKQVIPDKGPMIVVSNHPSTFMDPIIVASLLKQHAHFIAKGTLFNSVLKDWIMRNIMKSIPIYRRQDNPNTMYNNDAVFEQCFKFLESQGTLIIFPEGTSINERKLQEIKTGTARIALGLEARNNFELGCTILSVGINYSDAPNFRSDVWVSVEEPIRVADYKDLYLHDERAAVKKLTEEIRYRLEQNLIITDDQEEDKFITNVEAIYKNQLIAALDLNPRLHGFRITKGIETAVNHFETLDVTWLNNLKKKVNDYSRRLENNNLTDRFLARDKRAKGKFMQETLYSFFRIILGAPFYIYGLITNYIPYYLPRRIADTLTDDEEYRGPIKMTSGILTFSTFYIFLIYLFQRFIAQGDWWWTIWFAFSLPMTGFFAMMYYQRFKNFKSHIRLVKLFYKEPRVIGELLRERSAIIKDLDWAKEQYLKP